MTLIATDPVHVAYNGTYVTTPDIAEGQGTVQVSAEVDNESENNTVGDCTEYGLRQRRRGGVRHGRRDDKSVSRGVG